MSGRVWLAPAGLFVLALVIRVLAAGSIGFPPTEGSAYYVDVARNLVTGHGLISNAVWSYATPPLVAPKPAFELWLPMATFISALPMALFGASFASAQAGSVLLGALIAPLTWAVGREAARAKGLDERRTAAVALASGALAAVLGSFVIAAVGPDSTTSFLVFGTAAALLMPRALGPLEPLGPLPARSAPLGPQGPRSAPLGTRVRLRRNLPGVALGATLGLAYLSRQEAIWLGVAFVVMLGAAARREAGSQRLRQAAATLLPVVVGGLLLVAPWLLRQTIVFGSPVPGQALENAWLVHNEDIFAFLDRPTVAAFMAQGPVAIVSAQLAALWHQLLDVLILPAFPVGLVGLVALLLTRGGPAVRRPTALQALLVSGALTFMVTGLLFPVATLWGTFLHGSGPLLVGLVVCAALGADTLLAWVSNVRHWARPNVLVGPIALLALAVPLAALQVTTLSRQTRAVEARVTAVADELRAIDAATVNAPAFRPAATLPPVVISDHPMWLATALGRPVIALPDEPLDTLARLASTFDAPWLVEFDARGRYPDALLDAPPVGCLTAAPRQLGPASAPAWLFRLGPSCRAS